MERLLGFPGHQASWIAMSSGLVKTIPRKEAENGRAGHPIVSSVSSHVHKASGTCTSAHMRTPNICNAVVINDASLYPSFYSHNILALSLLASLRRNVGIYFGG